VAVSRLLVPSSMAGEVHGPCLVALARSVLAQKRKTWLDGHRGQGHPKHMLDIVCHIRSFSFNSHTQTFALQRRSLRIVLEEKQGWLRSRAVSLGNELSVTGRQAHLVVIDHRCSFFDPCWVDHTSGYSQPGVQEGELDLVLASSDYIADLTPIHLL
jgi:hypothetical protein